MKRTKEQLQAINSREKNVLVSASAGSGKTSIMIERIVKIILNKEASIESVLAVTFTKMAAEEMKARLLKALKGKVGTDEFVVKNVRALPYSDISTIHSFCTNLLRTYFFASGVNADFKIIEETDSTQLQNDVLSSLFSACYERGDERFLRLRKKFSRYRRDDVFKGYVLSLYNYASSEAYPMEFLEKSVSYYSEEGSEKLLEVFYEYKKRRISDLLPALYSFLDIEDEKWKGYASACQQIISYCEEFVCGLDVARQMNVKITLPSVRGLPEELIEDRENLKAFKKEISDIFDDFADFVSSCNNVCEIENAGKDYADLLEIVKEFDREYLNAKKDKNVVDFADLEHFTVKLLANDEICNEIKNKYKFIMVDEYQDVNSAQEYIIRRISKDNLFLVGDVKQSIYGFRGSNSDIFLKTKERFLNGEGEYIELKENFRSAKNVIKGVNNVFSRVMTDEFIGINYKGSPMKYGGLYKEYDGQTGLYLYGKKEKEEKESEKLKLYDLVADAFTEEDSFFAEGEQILSIINENIGADYYDIKSATVRKISCSDIVILVRSIGNYTEKLVNFLLKNGVKISCQDKNKAPDYPEINLIVGCLRLLLGLDDVPLAIALKSEMGALNDADLCKIRENHTSGTFVEAVKSYDKDDAILQKLKRFFAYYDNLRVKAEFENAGSVIARILLDTGMEARIGSSARGKIKLDRIYRFMNVVKDMSVEGVVDAIDSGALKVNFSSVSDDDSVSLMTMHASKGLEFPVVILANCSGAFNLSDLRKDLLFDRNYGVAVKYFDYEQKTTFSDLPHRKLVSFFIKRNLVREEARLFYVAMTRAKYKLFIVASDKKQNGLENGSKFLDFVRYDDLEKIDSTSGEEKTEIYADKTVFCDYADEECVREIEKNLNFEYPSQSIPVKKSVSELSFNEEKEYEREAFASTGAERGTAYHKFLEKWDFSKGYKEFFDSLSDNGFTKEEIALLNFDNVEKICSMEVFKELVSYDVFKEKNFVVSVPYKFVSDVETEEEIVVQGTIDLLALSKTDDKAIILDYKFSSIKNSEDLVDKYSKQLFLYKYAVEKILKRKAECYLINIYSCKIIKI